MNLRSITGLVVTFWITAGILQAEEKSWAPCHAPVIVTGKLDPMYVIPWLDGWHVWGTVHVREVHRGAIGRDRLSYQYLFSWSTFDIRNTPALKGLKQEGVWMLKPLDAMTFTSFYGRKGSWSGYADLSYVSELRRQFDRCDPPVRPLTK